LSTIVNDRAEIAAALNTVPVLKGYTRRPRALKTGDAWPLLPDFELQHGLVWRPTWRVIVVLPEDEDAAAAWMDEHFEAIVTALREPGFPESAAAGVLQTNGGDVLILEITMRSE
jgi:hypothetical protein